MWTLFTIESHHYESDEKNITRRAQSDEQHDGESRNASDENNIPMEINAERQNCMTVEEMWMKQQLIFPCKRIDVRPMVSVIM